MKKLYKYLPITFITYFLILISIAINLNFFHFSLNFFKGTIRGFIGIIVLLFQF